MDQQPNQEQTDPQVFAQLQVAHTTGGQTLIGTVERQIIGGRINPLMATMVHPFEIMVIPNEHSSSVPITLIPFGSVLGFFNELAPVRIDVSGSKVFGFVPAPDHLAEAYGKALTQFKNPAPTSQQHLHVGSYDHLGQNTTGPVED